MSLPAPNTSYLLLDSGDGQKLEQFGDKILARPSSVCIWKRRYQKLWNQADAEFIPGRDAESGGWKFGSAPFETWETKYLSCGLILRLQKNGQIGLFPEHGTYLPDLLPFLTSNKEKNSSPRLLNLFAYTGLASTFFAKQGWAVTHVDLSKKAISWAKSNFELNGIPESAIRFICDDALKFLEREVKRSTQYDAVIVDPPSFSRISKENYWKLEDILSQVVNQCHALIAHRGGPLVVTCHDPGISAEMIANLLRDVASDQCHVIARELSLAENESDRVLPAGSLGLLAPGAQTSK